MKLASVSFCTMSKYRLIPATKPVPSNTTPSPPEDASTTNKVENNSSAVMNDLLKLIELFPSKFHHRSKLMLSHLKGKVGVTDDNRVIYLDPTHKEEEEGSSLYDLVYFFISPTPPNGQQARPPDALRFGKLLYKISIPLYAYFVTRQIL